MSTENHELGKLGHYWALTSLPLASPVTMGGVQTGHYVPGETYTQIKRSQLGKLGHYWALTSLPLASPVTMGGVQTGHYVSGETYTHKKTGGVFHDL
jgi:hypothetical protein